MAQVYGDPGMSARQKANAVRAAAPVSSFLGRLMGIHTPEAAWRKGHQGEQLVARELAQLPSEWTILHDLRLDEEGHNIDHVVVGPAGAFALNTKRLSGSVWVRGGDVFVNGKRTEYRRRAKAEAARLCDWFERSVGERPWVDPILVVIAPRLNVVSQSSDMTVLPRRDLVMWLCRRPERLSGPYRDRLSQCLSAATTGHW